MNRNSSMLVRPIDPTVRLVLFELDAHRIAMSIETVCRVIRAVAVTPLPKAPAVVLGVIDLEGTVVPVFDLRRRLQLPARSLTPDDHFVIAHLADRQVALVVDRAASVTERSYRDVVAAKTLIPKPDGIDGLLRLADGIALVHDLQRFLSPEEARTLDAALHEEVRSR